MTESTPEHLSEAEILLAKQIEEMQATISSLKSELEPIKTEQIALSAEEERIKQEYQFKIAQVRKKAEDVNTKVFELTKQANNLKYSLEPKERELARLKAEREREEREKSRQGELQRLNAEWDKLTAGAVWREWAKNHQIEAGHIITEQRNVILADPPGLGKTLSVILTCDMVEAASRNASEALPFLGEFKEVWDSETQSYGFQVVNGIPKPIGKRIIYICPSSLMRNVRKEYNMWAAHRNVTFVGGMTKAEREFVFSNVLKGRADYVVIVNYEAWRKDLNLIKQLSELDPDTIILDEAHMVKDTTSIAYRGVNQLIQASKPYYVIPMTGTPILNRPQELFALLSLVNPKEFYHINDFLYKFCEQDEDGFWHFKLGGLDRIAKQIRPNFLRRTRDQAGVELPEKTVTLHELEVDKENYPNQARAREQMREHATIMVDEKAGKAVVASAMIALFTRLRQIETWPAGIVVKDPITKEPLFNLDVEESQKVDYVISKNRDEQGNFTGLVPDIASDERIVVFSQFKAPLHEIKDRIEKAGYRAVVLDGETPVADREIIANDFDARYTPDRKDSKWDVVLCNYKVGGIGLNFTAATQMVILDEEWNPGKRDQAYDRIHRMGQEKPVTIHVIRNQKTIDDWLANIMDVKEGMVEGFNNKMVSVTAFKEFLDESGLL